MPLKDLWHDGDSRYLPGGGTSRLKGVSAPEVYNPAKGTDAEFLGAEAKALAQSLTDRYGASYENVGTGYYGRPLEKATLGDGRDLGQEMVRHGVSKANIGADFQTRMAQRGAVDGIAKGMDHPIYNKRRANIQSGPPPNPKVGYKKRGILAEAYRGGARGVDNLQKSTFGLASYFGDLVNSDTIRQFGLEGQQNQDLDLLHNQPAIRHSSEINGVGDFSRYIAGTLGEVAPQIAPNLAAAYVGGVPAAAAGIFAQQVGETQASLNDRGLNEREAAVLGSAAIKTIPDLFGQFTATKAVGALVKGAGKKVTAKSAGKDLLKAGLTEGGTEVLQSAEEIRFLLAQDPTYKITAAQVWDTLKESGYKGIVGGAGLAGGSIAVKSLLSNREKDTEDSSLDLQPDPDAVVDFSHAEEVLNDVGAVTVSPDGVASYDPESQALSVPEEAVGDIAAANAYLVDAKGKDIVDKLPPETKASLTKAAEGQAEPETLAPEILNKALNTKTKQETVANAVDRVLKEGAPEPTKTQGLKIREFRHKLFEEHGLEPEDISTVLSLYADRKGVTVKTLDNIDDAPLIDMYAEALTLDPLNAKRSSEYLQGQMDLVAGNLLLTSRVPVSASIPPSTQVKGLVASYKALLDYAQVLETQDLIRGAREQYDKSVAVLEKAKPQYQRLKALEKSTRKEHGPNSAQYKNTLLELETLNETLAGPKKIKRDTNLLDLDNEEAEFKREAVAITKFSAQYRAAQKRVGPEGEAQLQQDLNHFVRMADEHHAVDAIYEARFKKQAVKLNEGIAEATRTADLGVAEAVKNLADLQGEQMTEKFARRAHGSLRSLVAAKTETSLKTAKTTTWWNKLPPVQQDAYTNLKQAVDQREQAIDEAETQLEILLLEHDRRDSEPVPGDELAIQQPDRQAADKSDRPDDEQDDAADNEFMHGTHIGSTETVRLFGDQQKVVRTSTKDGKRYTSYRYASVTTNAPIKTDDFGNPYIDVKDLPEDTQIHPQGKEFNAEDTRGENELVVYPPITSEDSEIGFARNDHVKALSEKYPEASFENVEIRKDGQALGYVVRSVWPKGQADEDYFFWAIALKGVGNEAKNVYKLSRIKALKPVYQYVDGKTAEGKAVKKVARDSDGNPLTTGEFEKEDINATHLTRAGQTLLTTNREGLADTVVKGQAFMDAVSKFISDGWRFPDFDTLGFRQNLVIWSGTAGEKHLTLGDVAKFDKEKTGADLKTLDEMQTKAEATRESNAYAADILALRKVVKKYKFKKVGEGYKLSSRPDGMSDRDVAELESVKAEVEGAIAKGLYSKRQDVISIGNMMTPAYRKMKEFKLRLDDLHDLVDAPYRERTRVAIRDAAKRDKKQKIGDPIKSLANSLGSHGDFVKWFAKFERKILAPLEKEAEAVRQKASDLKTELKQSGFIEAENGLEDKGLQPDYADVGGYGDASMVPDNPINAMLDAPALGSGRTKKPHAYKARSDDYAQGTVSPGFGTAPTLKTKAVSGSDRLRAKIKENSAKSKVLQTPKKLNENRTAEIAAAKKAVTKARVVVAKAKHQMAQAKTAIEVAGRRLASAENAAAKVKTHGFANVHKDKVRDAKRKLQEAQHRFDSLQSVSMPIQSQDHGKVTTQSDRAKPRIGALPKAEAALVRAQQHLDKAQGTQEAATPKTHKQEKIAGVNAVIERKVEFGNKPLPLRKAKEPSNKNTQADRRERGNTPLPKGYKQPSLPTEVSETLSELESQRSQFSKVVKARTQSVKDFTGPQTRSDFYQTESYRKGVKHIDEQIKKIKQAYEVSASKPKATTPKTALDKVVDEQPVKVEPKKSGRPPQKTIPEKKVSGPKPENQKVKGAAKSNPDRLPSKIHDEEDAFERWLDSQYNERQKLDLELKGKKKARTAKLYSTLEGLESELARLRQGRADIEFTIESKMNGYPNERQVEGIATYEKGIGRIQARIKEMKAPKKKVTSTKPKIALPKTVLDQVVADFSAKIKGLNIKVVEKQSEVSKDKRVVVAQVSGNTVTLVRENIANKDQALRALRHEVVGHLGLRKLLGADYDAVSKQVLEAAGKSQYIGQLLDMIKQRYPDAPDLELGDELLAFAAENALDVGPFRKLFNLIANAFRRLFGLQVPMDRAEVMALVARSERLLKKEGLGDTKLDDVRYSVNSNAEKVMQGTMRLGKAALSKAKLKAEMNKYGEEVLSYGEGTGEVLKDIGTLVRSLDPLVRGLDWKYSKWFANLWHHETGDTTRDETGVHGTIPREVSIRTNSVLTSPWFENVLKALPTKPKFLKQKLDKKAKAEAERADVLRKEISEALIMQLPLKEIKSKEVRKGVDGVRAYLKEMHTYLTDDLGMDLPKRPDYFPLVVDGDRMRNDKDAVIEIIMEELSIGKNPAEDLFHNLASSGNLIDMELVDPLAPHFFSAKKRETPEQLSRALKDYYVQDIEAVLISYTRAGIKRGVYNNHLGGLNVKGEWDPVGKLKARLDEVDTRGYPLISSEERKFIVKKAFPAYNGTLGARMPDRWRKINSSVLTYMNYRFLPLSVFANLVDPAGIAIRSESLLKPLKATWKIATDKEFRQTLFKHARLMGIITDDITDHLTTEQAGYLSNTPRKLNDILFKYNQLKLLTDTSRIMALAVSRDAISEYAQLAGDGTAKGKRAAEDLKELQVTADQVRAWEKDGMPITGHPEMNIAIDRWIDGAIVRPGAPIRMQWASDHRALLLGYLKSYMWGIYETLIKRIYHNTKRREGFDRMTPMIYATVATLPLTYMGYAMRTFVAGKELPDDEEELMKRLVLRSGLLGPMQLPFDTMESADRGDMALFTLAGPFGSIVEDMMMESMAKNISSGLPIINQYTPARKAVADFFREEE
ncbi:MAG: hypothetical protein KAG66_00580 [Methylococcales bacterium]|nr:hypothetical protein [Methylococcales bacterium]